MKTINGLDAYRNQYKKNAVSLRTMLTRAEAVAPRKYRGYTVAQLKESIARYEAFSTMDDAALRAHLSTFFGR